MDTTATKGDLDKKKRASGPKVRTGCITCKYVTALCSTRYIFIVDLG
jgi:hypothetical protein